jgi:hypothetical protein
MGAKGEEEQMDWRISKHQMHRPRNYSGFLACQMPTAQKATLTVHDEWYPWHNDITLGEEYLAEYCA